MSQNTRLADRRRSRAEIARRLRDAQQRRRALANSDRSPLGVAKNSPESPDLAAAIAVAREQFDDLARRGVEPAEIGRLLRWAAPTPCRIDALEALGKRWLALDHDGAHNFRVAPPTLGGADRNATGAGEPHELRQPAPGGRAGKVRHKAGEALYVAVASFPENPVSTQAENSIFRAGPVCAEFPASKPPAGLSGKDSNMRDLGGYDAGRTAP